MPENYNTVLIARYLVKYLQGECDKEEKALIEKWLEDPINRAVFENIKKKNAQDVYDKHSIDVSDIRDAFYKNFEKKRKVTLANILSYAAVVALMISFPVIFFMIDKNKDKSSGLATNKEKIELRYEAPVLLNSRGEQFVISQNNSPETIKEKNGVSINIKGNSIEYNLNATISKQIAYNTIKVPDCGNFNFTMSDGTKVWLNAGTTLKYPVPFHKGKREIFLDGEGYFEVTRNMEKPFIVNINKGSVRVLGTKFNVKSYEGKPVATTLVSGSVQVNDQHRNTVILKPNQQAVFTDNNINVEQVDPFLDIIWKDGYFIYKMARLDDIMQNLSKWYGFEYFYQNEGVADILFSARLKKFNDINEVFRVLENTGNIKFRIKNNTVIVTR